jgi:hypothetical protein
VTTIVYVPPILVTLKEDARLQQLIVMTLMLVPSIVAVLNPAANMIE